MSIVTYALGFVTGIVVFPIVQAGVKWVIARINGCDDCEMRK